MLLRFVPRLQKPMAMHRIITMNIRTIVIADTNRKKFNSMPKIFTSFVAGNNWKEKWKI
jgi:hypothetical protein